jgi:hypothetical protein
MWCKLHPSTWKRFNEIKDEVADEEKQLWTVALHDETLQKIQDGQLKTAKEKRGVVSKHIWSFIEPRCYIFPQLHFEIGVINMVLDNFYEFIEDQVEILTPEEKVARNNIIITESALEEAKESLEEWLGDNHHTLSMLRLRKSYMTDDLRNRALPSENRAYLSMEKKRVEDEIARLVGRRKQLEADVSLKKKHVTEKKKDLQKIQGEKTKINTPVSAEIENILLQHNISAAAYHGGKLNGVDCHEFICLAKQIFPIFQAYLLTTEHPDRCSNDVIIQTCQVHCDICVTLDLISSKIRLKNQVPEEDDYTTLEKALNNLDYLWKIAGLSYTPKVHSVLVHALDQMKEFQGIGDMLEDDVEHIHQIAARIESRTSRMKNKAQQAFVHSKIEAIQNSHDIAVKLEASQLQAKRQFKRRNPELDSELRSNRLKIERDSSRLETLELVVNKPHSNLNPIKFKSNR